MVRKLLKWFANLFCKRYKYKFVEDVPNLPKKGVVYLVGTDAYYWQAVMVCPCGCKKLLQMNLMQEYDPYWKYNIEKRKRITLSPSVHRMVGCKSHFWIRKGKIIWA